MSDDPVAVAASQRTFLQKATRIVLAATSERAVQQTTSEEFYATALLAKDLVDAIAPLWVAPKPSATLVKLLAVTLRAAEAPVTDDSITWLIWNLLESLDHQTATTSDEKQKQLVLVARAIIRTQSFHVCSRLCAQELRVLQAHAVQTAGVAARAAPEVAEALAAGPPASALLISCILQLLLCVISVACDEAQPRGGGTGFPTHRHKALQPGGGLVGEVLAALSESQLLEHAARLVYQAALRGWYSSVWLTGNYVLQTTVNFLTGPCGLQLAAVRESGALGGRCLAFLMWLQAVEVLAMPDDSYRRGSGGGASSSSSSCRACGRNTSCSSSSSSSGSRAGGAASGGASSSCEGASDSSKNGPRSSGGTSSDAASRMDGGASSSRGGAGARSSSSSGGGRGRQGGGCCACAAAAGPSYGLPAEAAVAASRVLWGATDVTNASAGLMLTHFRVLHCAVLLLSPGAGLPAPDRRALSAATVYKLCLRMCEWSVGTAARYGEEHKGQGQSAAAMSLDVESWGLCAAIALTAVRSAHDALACQQQRRQWRQQTQLQQQQQQQQRQQQGHQTDGSTMVIATGGEAAGAGASTGGGAGTGRGGVAEAGPHGAVPEPPSAHTNAAWAPPAAVSSGKPRCAQRPEDWWRAGVAALGTASDIYFLSPRGQQIVLTDLTQLLECQMHLGGCGQALPPLPSRFPPTPPSDAAAALSAGYLPALERLLRKSLRAGKDMPLGLPLVASRVAVLTLHWDKLSWLLAYGQPRQAASFLGSVTKLARLMVATVAQAADSRNQLSALQAVHVCAIFLTSGMEWAAAACREGSVGGAADEMGGIGSSSTVNSASTCSGAHDSGGSGDVCSGSGGGVHYAALVAPPGRQLLALIPWSLAQVLPVINAWTSARMRELIAPRSHGAGLDVNATRPVLLALKLQSAVLDWVEHAVAPSSAVTTTMTTTAAAGSSAATPQAHGGNEIAEWRRLLMARGGSLHTLAMTAACVCNGCLPTEGVANLLPSVLRRLLLLFPSDARSELRACATPGAGDDPAPLPGGRTAMGSRKLRSAAVGRGGGSGNPQQGTIFAGFVSVFSPRGALPDAQLVTLLRSLHNGDDDPRVSAADPASGAAAPPPQQVVAAPLTEARSLLRTCACPDCVNVAGDSEATLEAGLTACPSCRAMWSCGACQRKYGLLWHMEEDCACALKAAADCAEGKGRVGFSDHGFSGSGRGRK